MIRFYFGSDYGLTATKAYEEIDKINLVKIDFYNDTFAFLADELSSYSLFEVKKNIIVFNCDFFSSKNKNFSKREEEQLYSLLANTNENYNISFVCNNKLTKSAFVDKLKELSVKIIDIKAYNEEDYFTLFASIAKKYGKEINKELFDEFYLRCSSDYLLFVNECKKLFTYSDKITIDVIKRLISIKLDDNVFNLCNLMLKKDCKKALECYRGLKILNNDPIILLLTMVSQFRFIALVKYLMMNHYSNDEIAKELSTPEKKINPGRIYYINKDVSFYTYFDIIDLLYKLAILEENIKSNQDNADYSIEMFILG